MKYKYSKVNSAVIILNYNNGRYLDKSISSVLKQSRNPEEIIVCDDCSTDNSKDILKKYKDEIKVIQQKENKGPLRNCLDGIQECKSDIIFFLDADDIWLPNKIETILPLYEKDELTSIVSHKHAHIDKNGNLLSIYDQTHSNLDKIISKSQNFNERSNHFKNSILLRKGGYWLGSAYSFRKSVFDINLFKKLIKNSYASRFAYPDLTIAPFIIATEPKCKVSYIDIVLFYYRRHLSNSTPTSDNISDKISSINRIQKTSLLTKHLLINGTNSKQIRHTVKVRYNQILLEYEYLVALYSRQLIVSCILFLRLFWYFICEGKSTRECIRFFGISLLGPNFFLSISNKHYLNLITNRKRQGEKP